MGSINTHNNVCQLPTAETDPQFTLGTFSEFVIFNVQGDVTDTLSTTITTGDIACGNGSVIGFQHPIVNQAYTLPNEYSLNPTVVVSFGIYANHVLIQSSLRTIQATILNEYFSVDTACNVITTGTEVISARVRITSAKGSVIVGNRTLFAVKLQ